MHRPGVSFFALPVFTAAPAFIGRGVSG